MPRALGPTEVEIGCGLIANVASCCDADQQDPFANPPLDNPQTIAVAYDMAREALNTLTAGLVANCPVLLRPCSVACCMAADQWSWDGMTWRPYLVDGQWMNGCGCKDPCGCQRVAGLDLGGPYEVLGVALDGQELPDDQWRVDDGVDTTRQGRYLYRIGGDWPVQQDMDLMPNEQGTFAVHARPGYALGAAGERALGKLVCEFYKAACGQKCELPARVQSISREGVTMILGEALFPGGLMGIRDVDIYIASINPNALVTIPTVYSPDVRRMGV